MRQILISILLIFSIAFGLYGSALPVIVTVSNNQPVAGDVVTFTINNSVASSCSGDPFCLRAPTTDPSTAMCERLPFNTTITKTYAVPGNFTVSLECPASTITKPDIGSLSNTSNTAPAISWQLQNSSGATINPPVIVVSAAPAASAVPTLSEWGLIILALGILLFGIVAVRQRSTSRAID